jgi:hypothetical protein
MNLGVTYKKTLSLDPMFRVLLSELKQDIFDERPMYMFSLFAFTNISNNIGLIAMTFLPIQLHISTCSK